VRVKKDGKLICSDCGVEFPEHGTKYPDICDGCFCPHKNLGWSEDTFCCYGPELWPDMVAVLADGLKNTVPQLTLQDLADWNPRLKSVFESVGDKYKTIKVGKNNAIGNQCG